MSKQNQKRSATKRGDTIIEVVFAFAIFCMVAIISIAMMNLGIAASERSLELVTARNELNAQAEALRFIHSSYIAELSLPECKPGDGPEVKCQQYKELWEKITHDYSISAADIQIQYPPEAPAGSDVLACDKIYEDNLLFKSKAFVLNARQLLAKHNLDGAIMYTQNDALIPAKSYTGNTDTFVPASLNARIIYTNATETMGGADSTSVVQSTMTTFTRVAKVEGLWVFAVKGPSSGTPPLPNYYDFYIETCWYGANNSYPTALDTIIRLYNPKKATA